MTSINDQSVNVAFVYTLSMVAYKLSYGMIVSEA